MATTVGVGKKGKVYETFKVAEPHDLAVMVINRRNTALRNVEPTFGTEPWAYALELKMELALISENKAKENDLNLFYDTERKRLVGLN